MPTYQITAPDGKKLRITAPDGATQEQVLAYAQQQYSGAQEQPQQSRAERYADLQRRAAELPQSNPTDGMSGLQKFMAGVGKSFVDTGEGLQQLYAHAADAIAPRDQTLSGLITSEDNSRAGEIERSIAERRTRDAALMDTGAGLAGNIVGQTAQIAVPVPAGAAAKGASLLGRAAPYVGAATRGGAFSATQGTVGDESRLENAGIGSLAGVGGQALSSGASALARGAVSRLEPATAKLAQKAEGFGLRLGLPEISENPLVRTVASQMDRLPFSGATKRAKQNQAAFNREVGATFGANTSKLTPDKFAEARNRLSQGFDTLTERNNLAITGKMFQQLGALRSEVTRLGGTDTARVVGGWIDELLSKMDSTGNIPGKAYQSFDSRIGKVLKTGGEPAHYLGQLRELARAAMDDSISAKDRAAWNLLRKQSAAMKTVEPLVAKAGDGNISPQALMGRVTADTAGKARMATGRGGDLGDLARIGQRFLKASPNSGTADRLMVNAAVGGGLYGAQQQGWISPETAMYAGGGLLLNRLAGNALNSRALASGDSKALTGLARLMRPAPFALPAVANASDKP